MRRELAVCFDSPALVSELEQFLEKSGEGLAMSGVRVAALAGVGDSDEDEEEETDE